MQVIVIGAVAAGTKVAAKLKRENHDIEITVLTKSRDISYAGCALPYYVGRLIRNREELVLNTPEQFAKLTDTVVKNEREVIRVCSEENYVVARNLVNGTEEKYSYDRLVIATGARAYVPDISGNTLKNVFVMREPNDAIMLRESMQRGEVKKAIVVGGGFIGLEIAENLHTQGIDVSIVDREKHILPGYDDDMATFVERHLNMLGIKIFTSSNLQSINGQNRVESVTLDKYTLDADAVILSMGICANTEFLSGSSVALNANGTIKVDEYFQTSVENIYAAGDCICTFNAVTSEAVWAPMGSAANIQARLLAKNLAGKRQAYRGVLGTSVCKLRNLNSAKTGIGEAVAKQRGMNYTSALIVTDDIAGYYPGSSDLYIKLIAETSTHRLIGAQVLGEGAVDKIADIAAMAISMRAKLEDLENIDLCYAPPFSTAIHPFLHAVNVLLNKISGDLESVTPLEYLNHEADEYEVIEVSRKHVIKGATFVDLRNLDGGIAGYPKDRKLLLVCAKGKRAYLLQNKLKYYGYTNTKVLEGGLKFNIVRW